MYALSNTQAKSNMYSDYNLYALSTRRVDAGQNIVCIFCHYFRILYINIDLISIILNTNENTMKTHVDVRSSIYKLRFQQPSLMQEI